ncbi:MAG: hypothetical protein ACRDHG_03565 [Anaerolineales bacterium]
MLRSWWLPWALIAVLLLGIGGPEAYFYFSSRGPIPRRGLYGFTIGLLPVTLVAEDQRVYVYRLQLEEPLQILVMRKGTAKIERCKAGEGFHRWFKLLEDIRSGGRLDIDDFSSPGWASLTVGDEMVDGSWGGIQFQVHIPRDGEGPVVVERDGEYYAVDEANPNAWGLIWSGCAGLGARP